MKFPALSGLPMFLKNERREDLWDENFMDYGICDEDIHSTDD
jgi:hypothetical protein